MPDYPYNYSQHIYVEKESTLVLYECNCETVKANAVWESLKFQKIRHNMSSVPGCVPICMRKMAHLHCR